MYKIYFGEKVVILTNKKDRPTYIESDASVWDYSKMDIKTILQGLRTADSNTITLLAVDADAALNEFKRHFTVIQAGGGCVYTPQGELLLIFRRGKWDLPKGKLDKGETIEACAIREVVEETGVQAPVLGEKIGCTYHTYEEKGETILKESHWYLMNVAQKQALQPQLEEDIEQCVWVSLKDINSYAGNMQPSVKDILEEAIKCIKG